ncbi:NAD(P)-dependent oxidoreductase [Jidongwangia harbinensis]|uniref:NAD(P)-dependent oxidoreductase n=1 Tax=Jidongwangia harbinensis TaxID=2878561 RepID=UPI001CD99C62|nr:NAD(P)H-binding protein [Jidongwangia harbinensis]MCA2218152.1 NAD(P)H-binding protein [Jidongwangia harbinensis]
MKLTIFGATGGIGRQMVSQAVHAGHDVTAVVRDPARLDVTHPALRVLTVPGLTDPDLLLPALHGSDAVLSGVGPRGRRDGPVASTATRGILLAMACGDVRRFVAVSAVPVGPVPAGESFVNRRMLLPFVRTVLKDLYADLAVMEEAVAGSGTDWTVVRPPRLVNRPLSERYRTAVDDNVARGYTISRADVAHAMLAALGDPATVRRFVGIAY